MSISAILASTYIISILGLFVFIWSLRKGGGQSRPSGGRVIFEPGEVGHIEDPSADRAKRRALQDISDAVAANSPRPVELSVRLDADRSTAAPVLLLLSTAVIWLVIGSVAGLISSIKL